MPNRFTGTMRAKITLLEGGVCIEWINAETMEVIWTETVQPADGCAAVCQIAGIGEFEPRPGYFIDSEGKRHFAMPAETARFVRPR